MPELIRPEMTASELAHLMLEWEATKRQLDHIEAQIRAGVMQIGKTQTVGNVRATYSAGRKSYDYRYATELLIDTAERAQDADLMKRIGLAMNLHTVMVQNVDWRSICAYLDIDKDAIPFTQSDPSVTVKLVE